MFIWIAVASLLVLVVSSVALHKFIAMKLLASYYEDEVLQHNGRYCELSYRGHIINDRDSLRGRHYTQEEKEERIHRCAKKRALAQSRKWIRTELNGWTDRMIIKSAERKEARVNSVIDPLREKAQQAVEDKRMVESIVQELRNAPTLTEQEKFDKVFAHFDASAKEKK